MNKLKEYCLAGEFTELSGMAMIAADDEEREILSKNNDTAKRIKKQIENMLNDKKFVAIMEAHEEAYESQQKVLQKWAEDTARMMLEKGIDIDVISDETCLSVEEIEALK